MNKNYLLRRIEELEEEVGIGFPNRSTLLKFSEVPEGTLLWDGEEVTGSVGTITIGDVTGLQTELDGKASLSHSHSISDVTGLQTELDDKSNVGHTHGISDVTGLESALASKADSSELHSHANKAVLDSLSDDSGELLYDGSPVGVTSFNKLTDVPTTYGTTGQILVVNATGDGLVYDDAPSGGGGGASDFDTLTDTPTSKTGQAGKFVAVNDAEDALEYVDAPSGGGGGVTTTHGTWTPVAENVAAGDVNIDRGSYTLIGDLCFVNMRYIAYGNTAGNIFISGLPFTPSPDSSMEDPVATISPYANTDYPDGLVGAYLNEFQGKIWFLKSDGSVAQWNTGDRSGFRLSLCYRIDTSA